MRSALEAKGRKGSAARWWRRSGPTRLSGLTRCRRRGTREGALGVVERRVDGRVGEGLEHRQDDSLRASTLGEVVVGDRHAGARVRARAQQAGHLAPHAHDGVGDRADAEVGARPLPARGAAALGLVGVVKG